MTRYTVTLLQEHHDALRKTLFRDALEYGALLVCGRSTTIDPWTGDVEERFLVREVIDVGEDAFFERTPVSMTWSTTPFYHALKRVEAKGLALVVVHSHPAAALDFSKADDEADLETFAIAFNRLESMRPHLAMIMTPDGAMRARAYHPDLKPHPVELIRLIGSRWAFTLSSNSAASIPIEFDRQVRTFGAAAFQELMRMRVGVVGCGGTGSAVASLLARIGIRHLALFDADCVDETNLNRMHFSTRTDANLRRLKVDVVGEAVAGIGLPLSIARLPCHIDEPRARNALRACDVVFGCTDDHLGRNFLNRVAHFYLIPVIDLGLLIEPRENGPGYDAFDGRVTVVQPGYPCQVCRGLISSEVMLAEHLRRSDPVLYQARIRAGYIPDAPDPSPVVVTFTTELAAMAVNELLQRLTAFRGPDGWCAERVRRLDEVKDADRVPGGRPKEGCPLCQLRKFDGRGDMEPFLNLS